MSIENQLKIQVIELIKLDHQIQIDDRLKVQTNKRTKQQQKHCTRIKRTSSTAKGKKKKKNTN